MMALKWFAKVEYICDKFEAVIDVKWFMDLCEDDCPSFDPDRIYHAFWSPIEGDSPDLMLEKVPQIPVLSEKQQKAAEPGYYQVTILGIEDAESKFDISRTRKSVLRGRQGSKSNKTVRDKSEKSKAGDKGKAAQKNLAGSSSRNSEIFKEFDQKLKNDDDYDSDDSLNDPTLVSENQLKVLKSSLTNLKKKLLEKCKENEELQKKLLERETELISLRELNRGLQENVLQRMTAMLSSSASSRSSSLSSLNLPRSHPTSPLCQRSRSVSTSSSCSGLQSRGASPLAQRPGDSPQIKRKTPPTTPSTSGFKRAFTDITNGTRNNVEEDSSGLSRGGSFDDNSSSTTLLNDSSNTTIHENTDDSQTTTDKMDTTETADAPAEDETQVQFCEGFKVDKLGLKNIESQALGAGNDGTYVKELAVLVFGVKVLYNSSIKGRVYSKTNDEENKKIRKGLDTTAVEEIAACVKRRVLREFNGMPVPDKDRDRYKTSTITRLIYAKIKKMRQSANYKYLDESES